MKVTIHQEVALAEVDARFEMRLRPMVNFLQHGAGMHSARAGHGSRTLIERGQAWVLYRLALEIHHPPAFGDRLELTTWHRAGRGFRAHREYEIRRDGTLSVSATSTWLFIDTRSRKLLKIPPDVETKYESEPEKALDTDLDGWQPDLTPITDTVTAIQTRASDYDPVGHVNNAVYFDYIDELTRNTVPADTRIREVSIHYAKEIPRDIAEVKVGVRATTNKLCASLSSSECLHASAELVLGTET